MAKEPSVDAVSAAKEIEAAFYAKDIDRGYGQCPPRMLLTQNELANIIDRYITGDV